MPSPLNNTTTVGLTRTSPFYNADSDTCGDVEQNITNYRNIGGTTVSSGAAGPPAIITVPCKDFNNDLISDVGICTSWDNQASNNCSSAAQAIPGNNSKCNCSRLSVGNIVYKATCQTNSDCNDNNACTTDTCNINTDFKCTNTPIGAGTSCNDGNPCTNNDVCGGTNNTTCLGTAVVCSALDQCHNAGVCDFNTGLCTNPLKTNGTSCNDGMTCTTPDTCNNGACISVDTCPLGTQCLINICVAATPCINNNDCNDNNSCTIDTCVLGFCSSTTLASGTACSDSNLCTNNDICTNGQCVGTAVTCSALDQCHVAGVCDTNTGLCSNPNAPNNTVCDDSISCTAADICTNGSCLGTDNCPLGQMCQGNSCVLSPNCSVNSDCNDNNLCTIDSCISGFCSYINAVATFCNDANLCTTNDMCTAGQCAGTAVTCNAIDQCHVAGVCDTNTGLCSNPNAANNTSCDDGDACTAADVCTNGSCQSGSPIVCNNPGICQSGPGLCVAGVCNYEIAVDGESCLIDMICQSGVCLFVNDCMVKEDCPAMECLTAECIVGVCNYMPLNINEGEACGDNNVCHNGACVDCIQNNDCPYLNACLENTCNPNNQCVSSEVICPSGDQCNLSFCDLQQGCMINALNNVPCNDSFACTHTDTCLNGSCVGQEVTCSLPDTCSSGSCNINNGQCLFETYCIAPTFCNNALPQGECLQCDETHPCPNNLSCNNGTCVGCIDKNDCHNTDDCIAADCVNQECVYKYLDNCKYIDDDDGGYGNVSTSYMPTVPFLTNPESKI